MQAVTKKKITMLNSFKQMIPSFRSVGHSALRRVRFSTSVDQNYSQAKPVDRICVKVLFPFYARKDIIGLNGEHVNRLGLEYNCWIQTAPYGDMFPGTRETILLVDGSKENVMKVIQRVKCVVDTVKLPSGLEQYEWAHQRSKCLQILVPLKWGQSIKYDDGGKILSSLAEKHSLDQAVCLIKQRNGEPYKGLRESIVVFNGDDGDVMRAGNELIDMMLADGSLSEISKNLDYKRFYTANDDLPPLVRIKLLLPSYVIGKFMHNIKSLRADTECNIKLSNYDHLFPGSFERVLMVEGKKENVKKVIEKVNDLLDGKSDLNDDNIKKVFRNKYRDEQLKFLVPLAWGQKLIRKSGNILNAIKMKNELAHVNLDKSYCSLNPKLNEAVLTLGGEKKNVLDAGLEVLESMLEDADKCQLSNNLNYQQFTINSDVSEEIKFEKISEKRVQAKTLLPVYATSKFLGADGTNIKFLASLWNCNISIKRFNHPYLGPNENLLLIEGSKESVLKVLSETRRILQIVPIPEKLKDKNWVKSRHEILRLFIASSWVSDLMTNDGAMLQNIKEKYELDQVLLENSNHGQETEEVIIRMHGSDENCLKAANFVLFEMMSSDSDFSEIHELDSDI